MENLKKIGRYEIEDCVGSGLQGTVYRALDPELDRRVAIKLLKPTDPATQDRPDDGSAALEARISSKLRHPNIVSIFDFGRHQDHQYLVFEYVEGQTLRQLLSAHGHLSIEQVLAFAVPIVDAIAYAHAQGVVHLDLSPRNILVDAENNPRIMDFGLSQFSHNFVDFGDQIKGSPLYMSPEHFSADPLGAYTDVYALGASFYQLAAGMPVFDATTFADVIEAIKNQPADMAMLPKGPLQPGFSVILQACLEKDFQKRFQHGGKLKDALGRLLSQYPVDGLDQGPVAHSTVQFLLRRMQRKEDFPAVSRILTDINRLTGDDNLASAEKLANVILRDYGLTNKLLKLVNSAYFNAGSAEVTSVSRAIVVLGVEQVRSIANSLAYFGQMQGKSADSALRDSMIKSFLSGLLARHLVQRTRQGEPEEAFICGLFRNLGENLTIYYFPEEYLEIREMIQATGTAKEEASKRVLGVSFAEIGVEVAGIWGLPNVIIAAIRGADDADSPTAESTQAKTRDSAVLANALCDLAESPDTSNRDMLLGALVSDFGATLAIDKSYILKLFAAGMEKLDENAAILEFDAKSSAYCAAARSWITTMRSASTDEPGPAQRPQAISAVS